MSQDAFQDRLKRIGAAEPPAPAATPEPARVAVRETTPQAKIGRIVAGLAGFALGTAAAFANTLYRGAVGTTAEADVLGGLVLFIASAALVGMLVLVGLGSLLFGKRWWGLWAFVGGYLAAFGIAGFMSDIGGLS